jgi:hypothetical protein
MEGPTHIKAQQAWMAHTQWLMMMINSLLIALSSTALCPEWHISVLHFAKLCWAPEGHVANVTGARIKKWAIFRFGFGFSHVTMTR